MIDPARIDAHLSFHEAAAPHGKTVVIARRFGCEEPPVFFYQRRGAGVVSWTSNISKGAAFGDVRLAAIFAEFWMACDTSLGQSYLILRDLTATEIAASDRVPNWIRRRDTKPSLYVSNRSERIIT
jgi:hypothetical protein